MKASHLKPAAHVVAAATLALLGYPAAADETKSSEVVKIDVPKCSTPAKRLLIGNVTCRASNCKTGQALQGAGGMGALALLLSQQSGNGPVFINGDGLSTSLADMLASSLRETGCFDLTDKEGVEEVRRQMEALGKSFEVPEVDLIVSGSISSVGVVKSSKQIFMVRSNTTTSNLTFDTKVFDAKSAKVIGGGAYSSKSERSSTGVNVGFVHTGSSEGLTGTPLEDVAREAIVRATSDLVNQFARENITSTATVELPVSN